MPILIGYASPQVQKICLEARAARKELPQDVASKLPQRLSELQAFSSLGAIPAGGPLHFHALREDWAGHYAISINKKYRVIFRPHGTFTVHAEGMPDLATVTEVIIAAVEDYHG